MIAEVIGEVPPKSARPRRRKKASATAKAKTASQN
jgi:hypothetical protein